MFESRNTKEINYLERRNKIMAVIKAVKLGQKNASASPRMDQLQSEHADTM